MATRALLSGYRKSRGHVRNFHNTKALSLFHEEEKSGYPVKYDNPPPKQTFFEQITGGYKFFKEELKLWRQEHRDLHNINIAEDYAPLVKLWPFKKDPAILDKWVVTSDSDFAEGHSTCSLKLSREGTGIFSGYLDTNIPKDGKIKFAGYCNMRTVTKRKSFKREDKYQFYPYTHLVLRIRGDGRGYLLNLYCKGYFDLTWNDIYHYPMYTTGGPYWQTVKVPLSKFVFASKGVVQDAQCRMFNNKVTHFGITLGDKVTGPFSLEIDYIGLELDRQHYEEFAYEMYDTRNIIF